MNDPDFRLLCRRLARAYGRSIERPSIKDGRIDIAVWARLAAWALAQQRGGR